MMKLNKSLLFFGSIVCCLTFTYLSAQVTPYVDTKIGTDAHGHTFPGAAWPFGMVQCSPDTRLEGWDGCSAYHQSDSIVYGFSHTHLSGTGVPDYADVLIMPGVGKAVFNNGSDGTEGYRSPFDKSTEQCQAGYYRCLLTKPDIEVELTVTPRTGIQQYTFKNSEQGWIIIDLSHRDKLVAHNLNIYNSGEIGGSRISRAWAKEQHVYFRTKLSLPILRHEFNEDSSKVILYFDLKGKRKLVLQTAISAVDEVGAKKNLDKEWINFRFETARKAAVSKWEEMLQRVSIKDQSENNKKIFYTSLYHCLMAPCLFQDVDNRFRGMDMKIHTGSADAPRYTVFSLWDTYRAAHPLYQLLYPEYNKAFVISMLGMSEEVGRLPVWELSANETFCMIGSHSIPVIANALIHGREDYTEVQIQRLYKACKKTLFENNFCGQENFRNGMLSAENEGESVSKTIENSLDYRALAVIAEIAGASEDEVIRANTFSLNYKNLFNPLSGFFQARLNQKFVSAFVPEEVNQHYTEANAWQYLFGAHHDIKGIMDLFGGEKMTERKLDSLFGRSSTMSGRDQSDITGLIGQYAHGNEPSHHVAYLYNFTGKPAKTQTLCKKIMTELYTSAADGLCGNEDCGQMSAWYVFSSMGFYPVNPLEKKYILGFPIFDEFWIKIPDKKPIHFKKLKEQGNNYLSVCKVNGYSTNSCLSINFGDEIVYEMGNDEKAIKISPCIPGSIHPHRFIFAPMVFLGNQVFEDSTLVSFRAMGQSEPTEIKYRLNSIQAEEKIARTPFVIKEASDIYFRNCIRGTENCSALLKAVFKPLPNGVELKLNTAYANHYSAGGEVALIDGMQGSLDFHDGYWQGYQGSNVEIELKLDTSMHFKKCFVRCLQNQRAWIFLPASVDFRSSVSGSISSWKSVGNPHSQQTEQAFVHEFEIPIDAGVRLLELKLNSIGQVPSWHVGAGDKPWIFVDEIRMIK
ncbi:MAG TPA: GH92 family glycosyl hydrolase [Saprospiraceae bacterium]|nr:GH92 family glycosyl hydrolase [Saprospiraceae bacterium]